MSMPRSGPTFGSLSTTPSGQSECWSTPTSWSAHPSAKTISVLEQVSETTRTLPRGSSAALETRPAAVDQALVGQKSAFVPHRFAVANVEAEVEVRERPVSAELELFQDRESPDADLRMLGRVVAVHGAQRGRAPVDDRYAHELAADEVAKLETVAAGRHQEVAVA